MVTLKHLLVLCLLFSIAKTKKLPVAFQKMWVDLAGRFQDGCAVKEEDLCKKAYLITICGMNAIAED
ncbi:hypothetical protein PPYR_15660 [Photinus pyralis]|uniref:Saposin B-type domain-containing protein n=1 Tax=Photinus pyralis TaxID=7054 RepID=A0A5N4A0A5_PHOPY|nr:hypothetical protein PPYR_15660 [Photinus pyralis]